MMMAVNITIWIKMAFIMVMYVNTWFGCDSRSSMCKSQSDSGWWIWLMMVPFLPKQKMQNPEQHEIPSVSPSVSPSCMWDRATDCTSICPPACLAVYIHIFIYVTIFLCSIHSTKQEYQKTPSNKLKKNIDVKLSMFTELLRQTGWSHMFLHRRNLQKQDIDHAFPIMSLCCAGGLVEGLLLLGALHHRFPLCPMFTLLLYKSVRFLSPRDVLPFCASSYFSDQPF